MFSTLIGCALNVVLDPVAIFVMGWGMKGAALAAICLKPVSFKPDAEILKLVLAFPGCCPFSGTSC